jgi:hypothetical protein
MPPLSKHVKLAFTTVPSTSLNNDIEVKYFFLVSENLTLGIAMPIWHGGWTCHVFSSFYNILFHPNNIHLDMDKFLIVP